MRMKKELAPMDYLAEGANLQNLLCFNLSYSGETGDEAFSQVCIDLITRLCENQWVKMWVGNDNNEVFILPSGEKT